MTTSLKAETDALLVYVNVFGDRHAHLHFNIAPHRSGDVLAGGSGMLKTDVPPIPEARLRTIADGVSFRLGAGT